MNELINAFYATSDFLEAGGPVLKALAWVIGLFWLLTFERLLFLTFSFRRLAVQDLFDWRARRDRESWHSRQIRDAMLSRLDMAAGAPIPVIKTLVALCPLLGLLGTVTGMITIFDVMAVTGSGNARSMAEGVSRATIPTMAGMVAALAGVFGLSLVSRRYDSLINSLRDAFGSSDAGYSGPRSVKSNPLRWPLRMVISLFLAVFATAGLLLLMQGLIITGKSAITDTEKFYFIDFVRIPREEAVEKKQRTLKKPQALDRPPEFQPRNDAADDQLDDNLVSVAVPQVDTEMPDMNLSGLTGLPRSDGDYLPIVKVSPAYPRLALMRGKEGYVLVQFTVTTNGSVRDPVVIESSDPIFERAALQAAMKFKYKPRIVDGQPIEVHGVINKITFEIVNQ